jgi:hypothetical protein
MLHTEQEEKNSNKKDTICKKGDDDIKTEEK